MSDLKKQLAKAAGKIGTSDGQLQKEAIRLFVEEVNRRAERNMIKTHKLEGMHYAAMQQVRKELGI